MTKIKVGILISYDYKYVFECIKTIYQYVDEIVLAIDINRVTWSGNSIHIEDSFFEEIRKIDKNSKIKIYEDNFCVKELSSIENETRERNMLSKFMGKDCWQLQIDADEYFLSFDKLQTFLNKHAYFLSKPELNPISLRGKWITLFRKTPNGYLYIDSDESFSFGINLVEKYSFARNIEVKNIQTNFYALHQSWARDENEIKTKIENWGHNKDFDSAAFFDIWKNVNEENYTNFENFHPVYPEEWKKLEFIECSNIEEFIAKYNQLFHEKLNQPTKVKKKFYFKYLKNKFFKF